MLQKKAVDAPTLALIRSLQKRKYLEGFYLVGGTALALYYGHRKSLDIDLFSDFAFDTASILEQIGQDYPFQITFTDTNTIKGQISGINVDIIAHRYSNIHSPVEFDSIALRSEADILAMKLNALSVSGQRSKDFIDVYFGLKKHTVEELLVFYKKKYNQENSVHVLKSLVYFDDVDLSDWPVLLLQKDLTWEKVKSVIEEAVIGHARSIAAGSG